MPFYEYECKNCGHDLEAMQKINDAPLKKCPHCGKQQLQRLMSAPVFRLKGGGWYETDFKGDQDNKRNLADGPEPDGAKDSGKDSTQDAAKDGTAAGAESKAGDGKTGDGTPLRLGADAKEAAKPADKAADKSAGKSEDKAAGKPAQKAAASGKRPAARPSKRGAASQPKAHARRPVKKPAAKSKRRR